MKQLKASSILNQIIYALFVLLFSLTPLIMFTWTSELFEIPKMTFVFSLTVLIVFVWSLHIPLTAQFPFKRTLFDVPILLWLFSQTAATIISIHPQTSIWGWYSRMHGGLASGITYILLYYAFISTLTQKQRHNMISVIVFAGLPVAMYGILQHFGYDSHLWVQDVQNRVFSTLGQPNWLAAFLLIPLSLSFYRILSSLVRLEHHYNYKHLVFFIMYAVLFSLYYICLLYTRSRSGFLAFLFIDTIYLLVSLLLIIKSVPYKRLVLQAVILTQLLIMLISISSSTPFSPSIVDTYHNMTQTQQLTKEPDLPMQGGSNSGTIRMIVWQGAIELGLRYPWLGTGLETFGYSYYWTRPLAHNLVSEWDFLYNKAHNEYLNIFATSGLIGLSAYLIFILCFLFYSGYLITKSLQQLISRKQDDTEIDHTNDLLSLFYTLSICLSFITILITNFFGFSVVVIGIYFFLLPALLLDKYKLLDFTLTMKKGLSALLSLFLLFSIITGSFFSLHTLFQRLNADMEFKMSEQLLRANHPHKALTLINQALERRNNEPLFHDMAADVYGILARNGFLDTIQNSGNEESIDLTMAYYEQALFHSRAAIKLNPYHLNFWKNRAGLFISLPSLDKQNLSRSLQALERAESLAPTDPKITYNKALLLARLDQPEDALFTMKKAIEMKPDYLNAHYALALMLHDESERLNKPELKDEALDHLRFFLRYAPADKRALEKLEAWTQ